MVQCFNILESKRTNAKRDVSLIESLGLERATCNEKNMHVCLLTRALMHQTTTKINKNWGLVDSGCGS